MPCCFQAVALPSYNVPCLNALESKNNYLTPSSEMWRNGFSDKQLYFPKENSMSCFVCVARLVMIAVRKLKENGRGGSTPTGDKTDFEEPCSFGVGEQ